MTGNSETLFSLCSYRHIINPYYIIYVLYVYYTYNMFDPWVGKIPLEKEKVTHSSILAWRIPWTMYSPWGRKESNITELTRSWPTEWQDPAPPTRKPAQTSGPTSATRGQTWEEKLWSSGLKQRKERGRTKFKVRRKERKIRAEIETNNGKKTESFFFKNVNKID